MKRQFSVVVLSLLFPVLMLAPSLTAQVKRVYIANDDHTDYMWTADENAYRSAFLEMLDYYLDLADRTAGNPADFRSRFNPDGSFWARVYEQNRTAVEFARLIDRVEDGTISLPLTLLNLAYGAMPAEAVLRSMYYAGRLERQYGVRLKLALAQENQTLPFGLGTLFAGAGASYFWKGICGCASQTPNPWDRPLDMYWWTGLDGSRILTKWNSMIRGDYYDIGGYAEARNPSGVIDFVLSSPEFQARHPYEVIGLFGYGGDDLKTFTEQFLQTAAEKTTSGVRVVVSNIIDFFQDFAASYGAVLPSQSLSFGNEWDLLSASMTELSARVKRAAEKLRTAEAMAALVSLRDASFMTGREAAREQAWVDLGMYYDHDWTADGSVITRDRRAAWQRERAAGIESYVDGLQAEARSALGGLIAKGSNSRFFVFNSLGWARTGAVDLPYSSSGNVHVVDNATGLEAPSQIVSVGGQSRLRIWAENIPPVGYKTFDIVSGSPSVFSDGPTAAGDLLENTRYRLRVGSNGAVISLVDKLRGGLEMVRTIDGRPVNDLGPGGGSIAVENIGPVSAALRITASGPLIHETTVTLYRASSRIDIENRINQNFSDLRTWDFAFNLDSSLLRHEEVGAVILARRAENGGSYSDRAARTDWLTLNHFADLSAGEVGLTISSPDLSFLRRGSSAPSYLDEHSSRISILAGGQVDGASLGIPDQGGDASFLQRFALETHGAYDAAAAMRFALEHQNPLEAGEAVGGTAYPGDSFSLLSVSSPGVFVWAVKPAEDTAGGGIVVRLWNQTGSAADFGIQFNGFTVEEAVRTSLIETPIGAAAVQSGLVSGNIPGFGWRAYQVKLNRETFWPEIRLSKTLFGFGAVRNGPVSPAGTTEVSNAGTGTLAWTATPSSDWISVAPTNGIGAGLLTLGIARTDLPAGVHQGTVVVADPGAWNSPQTITVNYEVFEPGTDAPPFGVFDTPPSGSTVASSIPVTGWALDDIGIQSVRIYQGTGAADRSLIGEAVLVEGARPDVEAAFPGYPQNTRAGWGYMMLTNFLPQGDGPYQLMAFATDLAGNEALLGAKPITVDNAAATLPFGAIDTPAQGGAASGTAYMNFGWALTPQPKFLPTDGSSITVWVDGAPLGHPSYNHYRADIAALFPGYANSAGAVGFFSLNTAVYTDGLHTIAWSATDSAGATDGIGSRYFSILNAGSVGSQSADAGLRSGVPESFPPDETKIFSVRSDQTGDAGLSFPENSRQPVFVKRGMETAAPAEIVVPAADGSLRIELSEVGRVAVYLNENDAGEAGTAIFERGKRMREATVAGRESRRARAARYEAYDLVLDRWRPLPIGASFDPFDGVLYWQPGPGFLGEFEFVVIDRQTATKRGLKIAIHPRATERR